MTAKTAHKKIYQVAKEINISHETLIEYLAKRGHTVKSHMSTIDDEMMHDILSHFKKDKEVAEKHQRKIQSIRESRKKAEAKTAPVEPEPLKEKKGRKAAEPVVEEKPVAAEPEFTAPAEVEEALAAGAGQEEVQQPAPVAQEDAPLVEIEAAAADSAPAADAPAEKKPESFRVRRGPKMGLKVMGKIDLDDVRKREAAAEGTGKTRDGAAEAAESEAKKKKKKKRIRTETDGQASVEEPEDASRKGKKRKKTQAPRGRQGRGGGSDQEDPRGNGRVERGVPPAPRSRKAKGKKDDRGAATGSEGEGRVDHEGDGIRFRAASLQS